MTTRFLVLLTIFNAVLGTVALYAHFTSDVNLSDEGFCMESVQAVELSQEDPILEDPIMNDFERPTLECVTGICTKEYFECDTGYCGPKHFHSALYHGMDCFP